MSRREGGTSCQRTGPERTHEQLERKMDDPCREMRVTSLVWNPDLEEDRLWTEGADPSV
ncbi:unnamed protein product, partial [Nesidiocoris tenuis]